MKLVTYTQAGKGQRSGALVDDGNNVVDLLSASGAEALASVQGLIEAGADGLAQAQHALAKAPASSRLRREDVQLLAPVQPPIQMRDCLCFEGHLVQAYANARRLRAQQFPDPEAKLKEMEKEGLFTVSKTFYEQPIYYKANRFATIGTEQEVRWPSYSSFMDFELEFGFYISKPALDVPKDQARDYIFGYTIFNDFTARDAQTAEMGGLLGPAKGKDFDTANAMGPCLVTADEIPDPYNLTMIARVNGEEWSRASSRSIFWKFEDVIAHISRSETLHPGEFIGSGTVEGGCGLELMRFLKPGDVVELEVEGIGVLRNRLVRPG